MTEPVMNSCQRLMEHVFQYEYGSDFFYILLGATSVILCGMAWLLSQTLGGKAGFFLTSAATVLPFLLGLIAYAVAETQLVPRISYSWMLPYIPWTAFGLIFLLTLMVPSKKMLGLGVVITAITLVVATAAAGIAYYGANILIDMADHSNDNVRQHKTRSIQEIVD